MPPNGRSSSPLSFPSSSNSIRTSSPPYGHESSPVSDDRDIELARLKRMYQNLVEENKVTKSKKRKSTTSLVRLGRGVPKSVSLFVSIAELVTQADKHALDECGELDEVEFEDLDESQKQELRQSFARSAAAFKALCHLIPNFQKKVDDAEPDDLDDFYAQLQDGAINVRGDDVSKLMGRVASWLNQQYPKEEPLSDDSRIGRGIHHPITGMLLCPIRYDWSDEHVRNKLRAASQDYDYTIDICIQAFYRGFKGSMDEPERGFLQSGLLVKTFKHIFTSPSSAHDISVLDYDEGDQGNVENLPPPKKTRRTVTAKKKSCKAVAANLRMTSVTPRAIAYAAVQLALALSDTPSWCIEHNSLNFKYMYEIIIDYFEDLQHLDVDTKKRRRQLLHWWNCQVFPQTANVQKNTDVRVNSMALLNRKA